GLDRDQPTRAGEGRVPGDGLRLRLESYRRARLYDLRAGREELRGSLVVARVERLAPGADDAFRRRWGRPAASDGGGDEQWERKLEPQDTRLISRPWKHTSRRRLREPRAGLRAEPGAARDPGARARVRRREDRSARRRVGSRPPFPAGALRRARRAGADGRLRPGGIRRWRGRLPVVRSRSRGSLAGR